MAAYFCNVCVTEKKSKTTKYEDNFEDGYLLTATNMTSHVTRSLTLLKYNELCMYARLRGYTKVSGSSVATKCSVKLHLFYFYIFLSCMPLSHLFVYWVILHFCFQSQRQEYHQSIIVSWTQIRPDPLLGLIWVQRVRKVYQRRH